MLSMYTQPPAPNLGPPPSMGGPPPGMHHVGPPPPHSPVNTSMPPPSQPPPGSFQSLHFKPFKTPDSDFDGKRLRKSVMRKTVDYNSSVVAMLEARVWQRDERDRCTLQPDICYASEVMPPQMYLDNPINAVVTKFVRTSTNKQKCPVFALAWTPEGRRLVTGASSGEFTLWNGLTFNFETILKAHETSVRTMLWSHNDQWMVTGDTTGIVKYWQTNMNNVKHFQAHKDPVRGLSFSPTDLKLATCSDDGTVRIWDFMRCKEERVLRGHGADVKCVAWHPSRSLLASGSKDNQQPIKLWDPRSSTPLAKLHAHKSTVMDLKWNSNGNWLCSASRDHLLKLFDVRNLATEMQVFRGHKKEASCIAWHPHHEGLFASGGSDGSILFWHVGNDKEVGNIDAAHDGIIWDLAWHPLGHILASGSNDHTTKFWTRNRPGDKMRDKYNLNTLPAGVLADDSMDIDDIPMAGNYGGSAVGNSMSAIPGMGPDDKIQETTSDGPEAIPGLDFDAAQFERFIKKTPYAKPIPRNFQAAWNAAGGLEDEPQEDTGNNWVVTDVGAMFSEHANTEGPKVISDLGEELPAGSVPLEEITANAIAYFGFYIPLDKVPANLIQDAFSFLPEDEAIAEITKDFDFARKFCKEKRQLLNPNAKDEDGPQHRNQEDPFNYHNTQREGVTQSNRRSGGGGGGGGTGFNRAGGAFNRGGGGGDDRRGARGGGGARGFRGGTNNARGDRGGDGDHANGGDWGRGRGGRGGWRDRGGRGGPGAFNEGRGGGGAEFRRGVGGGAEWGPPRDDWRPQREDGPIQHFNEGEDDRGSFRERRPWHENGGGGERRRGWGGREEWGGGRREDGEYPPHRDREQPFREPREEPGSRGGFGGRRGGRGRGHYRDGHEEEYSDRGYRGDEAVGGDRYRGGEDRPRSGGGGGGGSGFRGAEAGGGYRGAEAGGSFRGAEAGGGYRGAEAGGGYRGAEAGEGYRGAEAGGYRGRRGGPPPEAGIGMKRKGEWGGREDEEWRWRRGERVTRGTPPPASAEEYHYDGY